MFSLFQIERREKEKKSKLSIQSLCIEENRQRKKEKHGEEGASAWEKWWRKWVPKPIKGKEKMI